jgi:hypothetical protein
VETAALLLPEAASLEPLAYMLSVKVVVVVHVRTLDLLSVEVLA